MIFKGAKTGFSLIELLVYMGCTLLLSGYVTSMIQLFQGSLAKSVSLVEECVDLAVALECLMDDLGDLAAYDIVWKECTPTSLIFTQGSHDRGWCLSKQRLVKITGEFCSSTQQWRKRATSIVLPFVYEFDCKPYYVEGVIVAFQCTLSSQHRKLSSFISLRLP